MQQETPFFLTKAKVVLTQDRSALEAKNRSVAERARLRFERSLLAERQKDLDHDNQTRLQSELHERQEHDEKRRKQAEIDQLKAILQQQIEFARLKRSIQN